MHPFDRYPLSTHADLPVPHLGAKGLSGKGAKGTMKKEVDNKKKPVSRSAKAGLQFPVGRLHRYLQPCLTNIILCDGVRDGVVERR